MSALGFITCANLHAESTGAEDPDHRETDPNFEESSREDVVACKHRDRNDNCDHQRERSREPSGANKHSLKDFPVECRIRHFELGSGLYVRVGVSNGGGLIEIVLLVLLGFRDALLGRLELATCVYAIAVGRIGADGDGTSRDPIVVVRLCATISSHIQYSTRTDESDHDRGDSRDDEARCTAGDGRVGKSEVGDVDGPVDLLATD